MTTQLVVDVTVTNAEGEKTTDQVTILEAAPTLIGVDYTKVGSETELTAIDQHIALFPGVGTMRLFDGGSGIAATTSKLARLPASVLPHVSFKPWDPTAITSWLNGLTRPVRLTYHHEPENDHTGMGLTEAQWQQMFCDRQRALADLIASHTNGHLAEHVVVLTGYWMRQPGNDWRGFWPGIGRLGADIYNDNWTGQYMAPSALCGIPLAAAAELGQRLIVSELGTIRMASDPTGTARAAWMRATAAYLRQHNAEAVSWWCGKGSQQGWIYHVHDDPERQAWRDVIAGQY